MAEKATEIRQGVHWIGVHNPGLNVFDELFPTRNGTTYNAYLVQGTEKTALIDTVEESFGPEYFEKIESQVPIESIDLVVSNHTEHDHSGALRALLSKRPDLPVYSTKVAANFLKEQLNGPFNSHVIQDQEEVDLGGRALRFLVAPSLHWPDTMMTYLPEDSILFSCDVFGAHFTRQPGIFDDEVDDFGYDFHHYFDTIMRPFKDKVRYGLAKLEGLPIEIIAPSHGPIRRTTSAHAIESYRIWSAPPPESDRQRALILVHSPHGSTRRMVNDVRAALEEKGLEVKTCNLIDTKEAELRDELERNDVLLVATPTVNHDAPAPVWHALALLSMVTRKAKAAAVFGSYGWSGEAIKLVEERLKGLRFEIAAPGLRFKYTASDCDLQQLREFGHQVADFVLEKDQARS